MQSGSATRQERNRSESSGGLEGFERVALQDTLRAEGRSRSTGPDPATCTKQRICVASAIKGEHAGRHFFRRVQF
jgi:hypothetical protein